VGGPVRLKHFFTNASLIVVDPVDKNRNVAAALSPESLSVFKAAADEFLKDPSADFFFPPERPVKSDDELARSIKARGTLIKAVVFRHARMNENMLYSQLRSTLKSMKEEVERSEFRVFKSGFYSNEQDLSVMLLEFSVHSLPEIVHQQGPPVDMDAYHIERFRQTHSEYEPYIKDGRWVVDRKRRFKHADEILAHIVGEKRGFGKNLRELKDASIMDGAQALKLGDEGFRKFMTGFLE